MHCTFLSLWLSLETFQCCVGLRSSLLQMRNSLRHVDPQQPWWALATAAAVSLPTPALLFSLQIWVEDTFFTCPTSAYCCFLLYWGEDSQLDGSSTVKLLKLCWLCQLQKKNNQYSMSACVRFLACRREHHTTEAHIWWAPQMEQLETGFKNTKFKLYHSRNIFSAVLAAC